MTYDALLQFINFSVLPAWALLILAPHSMLYPLVLGGIYIGCFIAVFMGEGASGGSFTSIEGIRALFSSDVGIVIGWAHYLVFDLFVGAWEARDAQRRGFNHWLLIPCLLLTFMAGPVGLVLYFVLRVVTKTGGWGLSDKT